MASTVTSPPTHPRAHSPHRRATRVVVATFGVLAALAGIEHGVGEILQGPVAPPDVVFQSWPDTAAFEILDGEPAMTVIPNLLASGILAIAVAPAVGAWSVVCVGRRHGGLVLVGLSVLLLAVGGGFGPPLIGIVLGIAVMRQGATTRRPPGQARQRLGPLWPWFLAAGVAGFLALMPGTLLLSELLDLDSEALVATFAAVAFGGLALALVAAGAHDRGASNAGQWSAPVTTSPHGDRNESAAERPPSPA